MVVSNRLFVFTALVKRRREYQRTFPIRPIKSPHDQIQKLNAAAQQTLGSVFNCAF
jgi:hypothetical protein